jgi:hypothetical protein
MIRLALRLADSPLTTHGGQDIERFERFKLA